MIDTPATMDEAIDLAAQHLPEGYRVFIVVEKGGYNVYLEDENTSEIAVDGGDGMRSDVAEAINVAIEMNAAS